MARKTRPKPVKNPSPNPLNQPPQPPRQTDPENVTMTHSTPSDSGDKANYSAQDPALDALVAGTAGASAGTPPPPVAEIDIAVYERLVKPFCFVLSVILDWINRRYMKKSFRAITDDQVALVKDDMAIVLKKSFDSVLPELLKRNPEWMSLVIIFVGIYTANTEELPDPKAETKGIPAPQVPTISEVVIP